MKIILACIAATICFMASAAEKSVAGPGSPERLIPVPSHIEMKEGVFSLPETDAAYYIKGETKDGLADYMEKSGLELSPAGKASEADILISIGPKELKGAAIQGHADEAYLLEITPRQIKVKAGTETGAFYAVQTLLQMTVDGQTRQLQCCRIGDSPRFGYRGLHFDVSRHFRTKEFLMKQMDAMALLKLNKMHLHLTDGAGWRIEIEQYPRLTEFAAWRPYGKWTDWAADPVYCERTDPEASGGYYTKDDIREILETSVKSLNMPGADTLK